MKRSRHAPGRPVGSLALALLLLGGPVAGAEAPPEDGSEEARIERILELRRTLARELEDLPPALRAEIERRWAAEQAATGGEAGKPAAVEAGTHVEPPENAPPTPAAEGSTTPAAAPPPGTASGRAAPPAAREPRGRRSGCDSLAPLDSNGDGQITAVDRYWRHLRLWRDDGDGRVDRSEVTTPFELDVRRIDVRLRSFSTKSGAVYDVWLEPGGVRFDLPKRDRSALLMIDADALARSRDTRLTDARGGELGGLQPLAPGLLWRSGEAAPVPLRCGG